MLSRYCEEIEAAARRADSEAARYMIGKLQAEHNCVQSALSAEFDLLSASKA